jgi:hypothetical protein
MDVFSVCTNWKIWLFFPPSNHNLAIMKSVGKYTKRLFCVFRKLQEGQCGIARPGQAFYIPTGWLHATYSIAGSMTIGTTWSSAEGLAAATIILIRELYPDAEVTIASQDEVIYFLRSLVQAFNCSMFEPCKSAMQQLCWKKLRIQGKEGPLLGGLKGSKNSKSRLKSYYQAIREGVNGSRQSENFWECEENGCESVVDHLFDNTWVLPSKQR